MGHNQKYFVFSGALAGLAVIGSFLMFRKLMKLEKTNDDFERMMSLLKQKTEEIKGTGSIKQIEAKISSIQMTLQSLEKIMYQ